MMYAIIRHNTETHCVFTLFRTQEGLRDFFKEDAANIRQGWNHIKTLAIVPVQDDQAYVIDNGHEAHYI